MCKEIPLIIATADDVRSISEPGASDLSDTQAEKLLSTMIDLGYTKFYQVPGPIWQRYIARQKEEIHTAL